MKKREKAPETPVINDRVKFKMWPWGAMALFAPVPAVMFMYFVVQKEVNFNFQPVDERAMALYCAGNSLILAMATGSMKRLSFAVPLGATAGILAVFIMKSLALRLLLTAPLCLLSMAWMFMTLMEQVTEEYALIGLLKLVPGMGLTVTISGFMVLFLLSDPGQVMTAPICGCLIIAATLPNKITFKEFRIVAFEGFIGLAEGMAMFFGLMVVFYITVKILNLPNEMLAVMMVFAYCVFNYIYMRRQFQGLTRDIPAHLLAQSSGGGNVQNARDENQNEDGEPARVSRSAEKMAERFRKLMGRVARPERDPSPIQPKLYLSDDIENDVR